MSRTTRFICLVIGLTLASLGLLTALPTQAAAGEITLKEVTLADLVNVAGLNFLVKSGDTQIKVSYRDIAPITKVGGTPRGLTNYSDWQPGDIVTVKGQAAGYDGGLLKIDATAITYHPRGISTRTITGTVEKIDAPAHKIFISQKSGASYLLYEVANVAWGRGPRLVGATALTNVQVGSKVQVTQLWQNKPSQKIKDTEVKLIATKPADMIRVLAITRSAGTFSVATNFPQPLTLSRRNKLVIYNNTNINLFLKAQDADRVKFSPALGNIFIMIPAGASKQLALAAAAPTGTVGLPLRLDDVDAASVALTLQLDIQQ